MKQFFTILSFELKNYFANKMFVGITVVVMALIMVVMFFPRVTSLLDSDDEGTHSEEQREVMLLFGEKAEDALEAFKGVFAEYEVKVSTDSIDSIEEKIENGEVECAFELQTLTGFKYYVNNLGMYDSNTMTAEETLKQLYQMASMVEGGMTVEEASGVMSVQIAGETVNLGKDQMKNFFYTYIMIFALYFVIILYGQMIAMNVATEKSSRAMELLITSAKPTSMMFGKIISSCLAGFVQLTAIFGSAILFYQMNRSYWEGNMIIESLFAMPVHLFLYMLLFFVLGFLVYAFMFGAIGSTATKLEDINTSSMPIIILFVAGFMVVMFSMTGGDMDSLLMKICSFIPFTSSMAMFTRIAMSTVPVYEIIISVVILIGSVIGIGFLAAKIYRVGVVLYGTPPKIGAIIKAMKES